jgi:hypothetical protein
MDEGRDVSWHSQIERVLADEGERCLCFSWLHTKSQKMFSKLSTYISLPVIVMSTVAGSASIGSQSLFNDPQTASIAIGVVSLSVGVLNTVSSYFGWAKRSESHRIAAMTYEKVYRFIMIELAMPRGERIAAKDMLKVVRDQCDRLQETSPQIPDPIINEFKKNFGESTPDVKKPEITNGLDPIFVYSAEMATPSGVSGSQTPRQITITIPSAKLAKPALAVKPPKQVTIAQDTTPSS